MSLGKFNFKATVREQQIAKLDDDLRVIDLYKDECANVEGNESEAYFLAWVKGRHGHRVLRSGWPDFLLVDKNTSKPFAVEVKSATDRLSRRQVDCFGVLERCGIPIYVWCPASPKMLTPWRLYLKRKSRVKPNQTRA